MKLWYWQVFCHLFQSPSMRISLILHLNFVHINPQQPYPVILVTILAQIDKLTSAYTCYNFFRGDGWRGIFARKFHKWNFQPPFPNKTSDKILLSTFGKCMTMSGEFRGHMRVETVNILHRHSITNRIGKVYLRFEE